MGRREPIKRLPPAAPRSDKEITGKGTGTFSGPKRPEKEPVPGLGWLLRIDMRSIFRKTLAALSPVGRWFGWWLALTGLVAGMTTCPCCGQVGCPVGAGMASFFGLLGVMVLMPFQALLGRHRGHIPPHDACPHCHDHSHHDATRDHE